MPQVPQSTLVAVNNLAGNTPSSPAQVGLVVGPTVAGVVNQLVLDQSINTIVSTFDSGPGSEVAATALNEPAPGTVYQVKSNTSIAGTVGSVTKTIGASVGPAANDFGAVLVAGADFNGDVLFVGKVEGAELELVTGMAEATLVTGLHVKITVTSSSTGTSLAALITGVPAALALWSATAQGTGASVCGQTLSTYSETSGRIQYQALTSGMGFETVITGASHAAVALLVGGTKVRVELGTNANSEPTSSAVLIQSLLVTLAAANPGKFRTTLAGSGSGLLGPAALTSLSFGSTGAMTVSGAPNDSYDVTVQVAAAGGLGTAAFRVSLGKAAGVPIYDSSTYLIPVGGSVVIPGTGLTLAFTGLFDLGDLFSFSTTAPQSSLGDIVTSLTYFLGRPEQAGLIAVAGEIPVVTVPAWVSAIGTVANQLESAKKYCRILLEVAGPAAGQSNSAWGTQLAGILAPLSHPRLSLFAGGCNTESALPLPQAARFQVVNGNRAMFARALSLKSGTDVGDQTLSGAMTSVISGLQVDTAAALAGARASYLYLLTGFPGVQADALLFDAPTGDFTYLTYGRVLDEAMYHAYLRQTKYLNTAQQRNPSGTIKTSAKLAIEADLRQVLLDKIVKPGNASDAQVVVDDTNADSALRITYRILLNFYARKIEGRAGVVRTLTATQIL